MLLVFVRPLPAKEPYSLSSYLNSDHGYLFAAIVTHQLSRVHRARSGKGGIEVVIISVIFPCMREKTETKTFRAIFGEPMTISNQYVVSLFGVASTSKLPQRGVRTDAKVMLLACFSLGGRYLARYQRQTFCRRL